MDELERRLHLAARSQVPASPQQIPIGSMEEEGGAAEVLKDAMPTGLGATEGAELPTEEQVPAETEGPEVIVAGQKSIEDAEDVLPPVDELVKRLRPEVLATLDELFQAKWTNVKRVQHSDLKAN